MRARDGEISTAGLCCIIINFCVECDGMLWLEGLVGSVVFEVCWCSDIVKWRLPIPPP